MINQSAIENQNLFPSQYLTPFSLPIPNNPMQNLILPNHFVSFIRYNQYTSGCSPQFPNYMNSSFSTPVFDPNQPPGFPYTNGLCDYQSYCHQYQTPIPQYAPNTLTSNIHPSFEIKKETLVTINVNQTQIKDKLQNKDSNGGKPQKLKSAMPKAKGKIEEDGTLKGIRIVDEIDPLPDGNYKYRNAYKSFIRKMNMCAKRNKEKVTKALEKAKYTITEINHAFERLDYYNDLERKKGFKKLSPQLIKYSATFRSPYSYILKEALEEIMKDWTEMKLGI